MVVFTGWSFASSCSPPHLSATQLLSATKGQLPLRSGLSPNCWSALVGALAGIVDAGSCDSFRKFLMRIALITLQQTLYAEWNVHPANPRQVLRLAQLPSCEPARRGG